MCIRDRGNSISPAYLQDVISLCEGKDISVNIISKSGTTTEPAIAFRVFRSLLEKKYGKEWQTTQLSLLESKEDNAARGAATVLKTDVYATH